ncbi:hypothetical protein EPH_0056640 [Eimeria praecox]|uniref:Uncharacterized protein n=1 Tax=Eimeria praecox TaxID=51316 RepID=U6GTR8_9EIME|nr:hypothetical protein EPH_0056640 [Eimeria praecox]
MKKEIHRMELREAQLKKTQQNLLKELKQVLLNRSSAATDTTLQQQQQQQQQQEQLQPQLQKKEKQQQGGSSIRISKAAAAAATPAASAAVLSKRDLIETRHGSRGGTAQETHQKVVLQRQISALDTKLKEAEGGRPV